ncbi:DUF3592 domain-containing protein [Luedemannella helvata]|uniref:DUF3592 domain-containing protein n=1 Tax=Luedemannella helvata TaxID=349315 RepID=A0ABP4WNF7_9ACTN
MFAFGLGIAPAVYCVDTTARNIALFGDRPTADAEVVAWNPHVKGNGGTLTVRFVTADGRTVTTIVYEMRDRLSAGDRLRVRYNAERPRYARAADAGPDVVWPLVAGLVAMVALGGGLAMGWRACRSAR